MKFRGKATEIVGIQNFARIVSTVSKLAKSCVLRLTTDKLFFILTERVQDGGVSVWCEILQDSIFSEWSMEGLHPVDANEILMEVMPDSLVKALRHSTNIAKSMKLKLSRKHVPCLCLELELPSLSTHSRYVTHDVPVNVLPRRLWADYSEPRLPDFDLSVYMPSVRLLRGVCDRMKNLSTYVLVTGTSDRHELALKVQTQQVEVGAYFTGLNHPTWDGPGQPSSAGDQVTEGQGSSDPSGAASSAVEVRVDLKRFAQVVASLTTIGHGPRVICNLVHERMIHCLVVMDDVSLQYFVPATAA